MQIKKTVHSSTFKYRHVWLIKQKMQLFTKSFCTIRQQIHTSFLCHRPTRVDVFFHPLRSYVVGVQSSENISRRPRARCRELLNVEMSRSRTRKIPGIKFLRGHIFTEDSEPAPAYVCATAAPHYLAPFVLFLQVWRSLTCGITTTNLATSSLSTRTKQPARLPGTVSKRNQAGLGLRHSTPRLDEIHQRIAAPATTTDTPVKSPITIYSKTLKIVS